MSSAVSLAVRRMEIPTYVLGPDSPYPALMFGWEHGFYPYASQLDIRTEKRPVQHRVVVLENDYVQAVILPDMGGRLFSLFDKVAQQHTFMVPPSVKYQNISMRGAWIAGGIELNFGHRGHNVCTVNPVSWVARKEDDGSVSVFVGATVRPLDQRWMVRYNLRPDRAAIDMDIHTMSGQILPGLMYWWTNSAVEVGEQSRFYYFGHKASGHALHSWPITDGLDYSWYRNRLFGSDMFLSDPQTDYMGFYDFDRHHGMAQIANRYLAPGQKYFTWGVDPRGRFWDWLLSDSEQTYCEVQRGRLETQGVTEPIPPMSVDGWTESWMPINRTEGFGGLENDLVISVVSDGESAATVRLLGVRPRRDLRVEAFFGDESLARWTISELKPCEPAVHRVPLGRGQACKRVRVTAADGSLLMDWTEFEYRNEDWTSYHKHFDEAKASLEELFIEAERVRFDWWPYHPEQAVNLHEKILARDPGHTGSLRAMADIDFWRGEFDKAEQRIREALKRRPMDPSLQMLLGWTLVYRNQPAEAVGAFMTAGRYEPNHRNGLVGAVSALIKAGRFAEADRVADELVARYPADRWAMLMKVMTLRELGQVEPARQRVADLLRVDPLWPRATAEALLLGIPANLAEGERKLADDCIVAAGPYLELGQWKDAATILEQEESDEPFSPAIRLSHLLWAQHKMGDKAGKKATLKALRQAPIEQANPWSSASLVVLAELAAECPEESLVQVMYGNILASRKRLDDAVAAWKKAEDLGLEHTVLYRNLAAAHSQLGQKEAALGYYRKAWKLAKGNVNLFSEFDRFLAGQGLHKERDKIYQQLPADARDRSMVALRRVPQLLDLERYDDALAELEARTFLAGEGAERISRVYYIEALHGKCVDLINKGEWQAAEQVMLRGLEYPRNLNAGRQTIHPAEALVYYMLGLIAEAMGRKDEAQRHYIDAASEVHYDGEPAQAYEMLAWLALGNWPRAAALVHCFERIGRGEAQANDWCLWYNGRSSPKVGVGFAHLVKGRLADAREVWKKVLTDEERDARWMRPHLRMCDELLGRIYRDKQAFVEQVHADSRARVERLTGPKACSCEGKCCESGNGQPAAKPTVCRPATKKTRR